MVVVAPLVALLTLATFWFILGIAALITIILLYIADVFEGLPFPLNKLSGPIKSLAQGITHVCGIAENKIDSLIGAAWHLFARYLDHTWHQFVANAHVLAMLAKIVGDQIYSVSGLRSLVHDLTRAWHGIEHGVKTLTREYHGIERRVKALERSIARGIGHDLRIEIKALERTVTKIDHKVIPAIRSEVATAEHDVSALEKWIASHALLVGTTALTGAVAWALSQLGLGGLRCPSFLNSLNKRGCGLFQGLEDILGLFVDTLLLTNVCALIPLLETAVSDVADPVVVALTDIGAGLCSGGIGAAPALNVPALSLPVNPGFTLNLP